VKRVFSLSVLIVSLAQVSAATSINSTNKHAYGANIGWLNFEATGNPRIILSICTAYGRNNRLSDLPGL